MVAVGAGWRSVAVLLLGLSTLTSASAAYRCVAASGKVSYSDRPCENVEQSGGRIHSSGVRVPTRAQAQAAAQAASTAQQAADAAASNDSGRAKAAVASAPDAPPRSPTPRSTTGGASPVALDGKALGPSHVLAACSMLVSHCAGADKTLDTCFKGAPRCTSAKPWADGGSLACCPQACVERYAALRQAGEPEMPALEQTLHIVNGQPSCAVRR